MIPDVGEEGPVVLLMPGLEPKASTSEKANKDEQPNDVYWSIDKPARRVQKWQNTFSAILVLEVDFSISFAIEILKGTSTSRTILISGYWRRPCAWYLAYWQERWPTVATSHWLIPHIHWERSQPEEKRGESWAQSLQCYCKMAQNQILRFRSVPGTHAFLSTTWCPLWVACQSLTKYHQPLERGTKTHASD